ncbi:hypothetical protein QYF61_012053 [Mycteria americana]|uniref:Uncharacterized protein n=1 Tax=Mycteria americana TaxID=33587 RepID=A0AAN7NRB1_MYCAM|nr:hypothetical protein QYF61_012053 [Mycteria americana]
MVTEGRSWGLEDRKYHSYLQEGQKGRSIGVKFAVFQSSGTLPSHQDLSKVHKKLGGQTGQRAIPYHMMSCSVYKLGGVGQGTAIAAQGLAGRQSAGVFNGNDRPWAAWSSELEDHNCGNGDFPFVDTEIVSEQLYQLNVCKSMGPDGIQIRVLKELADVRAGPLSIIYQRSWESGEVPTDWKLANIIPI